MERTRPAGDAEVERTDRSGPVCAASVADGCGPEDGLILQTGGEAEAPERALSQPPVRL